MTHPEVKDVEIPEEIVEKWQKIVDIMAEVVDIPAGLIMRVKPPYIEVFRSSETEENPYEVGDEEHLAGLYCEEVIKSEEKLLVPHAQKDEKWKNNPDVELGMISYLGFPLKWPDGDFFGTICVLDSEENRYGEKYEDLMRQFKELVESHLQLIHQRKELEKQIQEREEAEKREEFLHSLLRHNLRNKLQASMGYGELLKDTDLTEEQKEMLGKDWEVKQEALDLIEKVRKLRKATKEEVGEVELNPILQSSVEKYLPEASKRDMDITVEETDAIVEGGSLLEELFSNLVVNSIIHSKGSEMRIQVRGTDGEITITVEDDGKGISDEDKDKIFEKEFKDSETGGTGLGLYLVKEIAESYGGGIEVKDSELGGTKFNVTLRKP